MKKVFRLLCIVLLVALTAALTVAVLTGCQHYTTLVVFNSGDYMAEKEVCEAFEKWYYEETGERVRVDVQNFETNEDMYTRFKTTPDEYDMVCPSDYMIEKMIREGLVQKLNYDNIPNMKDVDESVLKLDYDPKTEYTVPYFWGTLGILYNTDKISEAEAKAAGWGLLWNSTNLSALSDKKVLMKNSLRDALVAAALYKYQTELRAQPNLEIRKQRVYNLINMTENLTFTNADELIRDVESLMGELNKVVGRWEVDEGKTDMKNQTYYVNLAWSGDAVISIAENQKLAYFVPEEGSNIWVDAWVVSSQTKHKALAEAFANFLLRPEIALMNMNEVGYTAAVKKSVLLESPALAEYGGAEFLNDDVKYPTEADLAVCAPMRDFGGGDKEEKIGEMWMRTSAYRDR